MDMTKEVRIELRELKRLLRNTQGEQSRTLANCRKAQKVLDRAYKRVTNGAERLHKSESKAIERDRRNAMKHCDKTAKAINDRIAVLEGRIA